MGKFAFLFLFVCAVFAYGGANEALATTYDVTISSSGSFSPASVTISTGDTVRWTSNANFQQVGGDTHPSHTLYPDPQCPTGGCWQSPVMMSGSTYSFTFRLGGTWGYHNHLFETQLGTVVVNDLNAPAAISNLAISSVAESSITLTWTSPGDDVGSTGNFGTPTLYDIRRSAATTTEGNWASGIEVIGEPSPGPAGTSESMVVAGLDQGTMYYFALKSRDEVPNTSALSNVISTTTLGTLDTASVTRERPQDFIYPASITDLSVKVTNATSAELSWTAPGDDGPSGTSTAYDIRYASEFDNFSLSQGTWPFAAIASNLSPPQSAGSKEKFVISGLSPGVLYYFGVRAEDEVGNIGQISNVASLRVIVSDTTPPARITDLAFRTPSPTSVELIWTAPWDDSSTRTAARYDIRSISITSLSETTWPSAIPVLNPPRPKAAGANESFLIEGLSSDTTYFIGLKAADEADNQSILSNIVMVTASRQLLDVPMEKIPPSLFSDGEVLRATGDTKVYVIIRGKKLWIPTAEAFLAAGYNWNKIREISSTEALVIEPVTLLRAEGRPEVYAISLDTRRHILSAEAFNREGYSWDNVVVVSGAVASWYRDATLLRAANDTRVYVIDATIKRWISTAEIFVQQGYDWGDVVEVSRAALDGYVTD